MVEPDSSGRCVAASPARWSIEARVRSCLSHRLGKGDQRLRSILIAHKDVEFSNSLVAELRAAGYHVIECPGQWPPAERCIRCDKGFCPLTEAADLMIYDPQMSAVDEEGNRQ